VFRPALAQLLGPSQGVAFCDILPIFRIPLAFEALITHIIHHLVSDTIQTSPNKKIDVVIGLDARGFLLGPVIALRLGAAFVPVRKRGKLPGECVRATYEKEYGTVRPWGRTSSWWLAAS
jgi:adenine phosphoribosyltransferase